MEGGFRRRKLFDDSDEDNNNDNGEGKILYMIIY